MISVTILFPTFDEYQVNNDKNNADFHQWLQAACDTAHPSQVSIFIKISAPIYHIMQIQNWIVGKTHI